MAKTRSAHRPRPPKTLTKKTPEPTKNGAKDDDGPDVADLSIKSKKVFVGGCVLTLREPGWCTLKEISKMLLSENLAENVKKLTGLARGAFDGVEAEPPKKVKITDPTPAGGEAEIEEEVSPVMRKMSHGELVARYLGTIVDVLRGGVLPLIADQLGEIPVILLDTQKNRDIAAKYLQEGLGDDEIQESEKVFPIEWDEDELDTSMAFRRWVRRSMTATQLDHVLERFQALRGWVEVGKRIAGRFGLGDLALSLTDEPLVPSGSQATQN